MPVTVRFDPTSVTQQAQIIPDATPNNDGVMTKEQATRVATIPHGQHIESGIGQMSTAGVGSGTDFLDVTFSNVFADTSYTFRFDAFNSDGDAVVGLTLISKTTTGMRIGISAPFNGEIAWQASVF